MEQWQRHRARQLLQRAHRSFRIHGPERQSLQPLGIEHLLRRRTRPCNTQSGANDNGRAGSFNSTSGAKGAGYQNNTTGGSGGAVKTQGGDVYAGHDGNVYKHTDTGWSKYNDGSWNPVQPPANHPDRPTTPASAPGTAPGSRSGRERCGASERGNYQQLEQDRLGRQSGGARGGTTQLRQQRRRKHRR